MTKDFFLFVSPHLDDIALSCGGLIRRLVNTNQSVSVLTIFTADLPAGQSVSWLAQRNHRAWDLPERPFAARCAEDLSAINQLGAQSLHAGMLDVIYRAETNGQPLYQKTVVGVPVHTFDWEYYLPVLQEKLRDIDAKYTGQALHVFCPLTLGKHVDHIFVRRAIESVWAQEQIIYYEDFPYAGRPGVMAGWLEGGELAEPWNLVQVALSEEEIQSRVASVACYRSQLRGLFPSRLEQIEEIIRARIGFLANYALPRNPKVTHRRMETYIRDYIEQAGGERYWLRGQPEDQNQFLFRSINTR